MLERDTNNAWVAGVAAGIAERYNVNVFLVRVLFVASFFLFGIGLLVYWLLWSGSPENNNQIHINFSS